MKRLFTLSTLMVLALLTVGAPLATADVGLTDWGFNVNGTKYLNPSFSSYLPPPAGFLPGYFDTSAFSFATGLGTIKVSFNPGVVGSYFFTAYFDHEIANGTNSAYNEYGDYPLPPTIFNPDGRVPAAGQTWSIGDAAGGLGYPNFLLPALDDDNHLPIASGGGDVAMGMGWQFSIADPTKQAVITLNLTTTGPPASPLFYLSQHDDLTDPFSGATGTNEVVYLSGTVEGAQAPIPNVPEPAAIGLLGTVVAGLLLKRWHAARHA